MILHHHAVNSSGFLLSLSHRTRLDILERKINLLDEAETYLCVIHHRRFGFFRLWREREARKQHYWGYTYELMTRVDVFDHYVCR